MRTTVPALDFDLSGTATYGLGTFTLSCGGVARRPRLRDRNGVTEDGRAATIVVTGNATSLATATDTEAALDTALCG